MAEPHRTPRPGAAPFPYFVVRAAVLSAGLALLFVAKAHGPLEAVAWCLVGAPVAGELVGSFVYLRRRTRGSRPPRR
jgi:hypothetical protein